MWRLYQRNYRAVKQFEITRKFEIQHRSPLIALYSSDNSNTTDGNNSFADKLSLKRSKLSPTTRISEMLSINKCLNSDAEDTTMSNMHPDNSQDFKKGKTAINPINYDSSNPRSVKNMSYIDTNSKAVHTSKELRKRMIRRKTKTLSVEERIQSLNDSMEDK